MAQLNGSSNREGSIIVQKGKCSDDHLYHEDSFSVESTYFEGARATQTPYFKEATDLSNATRSLACVASFLRRLTTLTLHRTPVIGQPPHPRRRLDELRDLTGLSLMNEKNKY